MRKQLRKHSLYIRTDAVGIGVARECFFRVLAQQFIQVSVSSNNRKRSDLGRKNYLIGVGFELDIARQKRSIFGGCAVAMVPDRHFSWR
jgi:hypothetical protein